MDGMEPSRYRRLTDGNLGGGTEPPPAGTGIRSDLTVCARCHESETAQPVSTLVPRLAGQSRAYLAASLRAYANRERESGIMQPVAAELDDREIERLAAHYASLPVLGGENPGSGEAVQLGEQLALEGDLNNGIPDCQSCHGDNAAPEFPRLAGQSERYLREQLHLWKKGLRQAGQGAIMAPIANRLTDEQIAAVATWYASQPPEQGAGGE
jgi:cytochrome c553